MDWIFWLMFLVGCVIISELIIIFLLEDWFDVYIGNII